MRLTISRLALGAALLMLAPARAQFTADPDATAKAIKDSSPVPRLPDGRPDFTGNWYKAGSSVTGFIGLPAAGAARPRPVSKDPPDVFRLSGEIVPYTAVAIEEKKWRAGNQYLDGEPRCHLAGVPRADQQPPYPHFIIQDDKYISILYEYLHEPRIVPFSNAPYSKNYRGWGGEARAHWEGDTLVVETRNFNGRTWLDMDGNFVDERLRTTEKFTMVNGNNYKYEAILTDPGVLKAPLKFSYYLHRQDNGDQLLEYSCLEGEMDLQSYYGVDYGAPKKDLDAKGRTDSVDGCLRGDVKAGVLIYTLETRDRRRVPLAVDQAARLPFAELIDREVRLHGNWGKDRARFDAGGARATSEGCSWNGQGKL